MYTICYVYIVVKCCSFACLLARSYTCWLARCHCYAIYTSTNSRITIFITIAVSLAIAFAFWQNSYDHISYVPSTSLAIYLSVCVSYMPLNSIFCIPHWVFIYRQLCTLCLNLFLGLLSLLQFKLNIEAAVVRRLFCVFLCLSSSFACLHRTMQFQCIKHQASDELNFKTFRNCSRNDDSRRYFFSYINIRKIHLLLSVFVLMDLVVNLFS